MKILKRWMVLLLAVAMTAAVACALTACGNGDDTTDPDTSGGSNKLASPAGFTFDATTGDYSFTAVENGQFYYVVVNMYDNKGEEYTDIIGMTSMIPGTAGQTISGTMDFYKYSDATIAPGGLIPITDLPKANYIARCIATGSGYTDSDAATVKFTIGGELEFPKVTYQIEDGTLTADVNCYYLEHSRWWYGLPGRIEVYVRNADSGEVLQTLTFDDWSYNTRWLAYKTYFLFDNATQSVSLGNVSADDVIVTAKAFGYGDAITDSDEVYAWNHEAFKRVVDFSDFGNPKDGWDDGASWYTAYEA